VLQSMGLQRVKHDLATEQQQQHAVEYYLAIKNNEILIHAIIWMNHKNIVLSERSRHKQIFYFYEVLRREKLKKTVSILGAECCWE